jgi:hypothetical protein
MFCKLANGGYTIFGISESDETRSLSIRSHVFHNQIMSFFVRYIRCLRPILDQTTAHKYSKISSHNSYSESLHWLKITERIPHKILSITYKCLLSDKPAYLQNLLAVQITSTMPSSVITLKHPYMPSRLKVSNRSFCHSALSLWNTLPKEFRQFNSTTKSQPVLLQLSHSHFHKKLKTHLFAASFPT